jgi:hypothetical protein
MKFNLAHLLLAFTAGTMITTGVLFETAQAGQPHMDSALDHLRSARHQLEVARPDKGGHRENAIGMIDNAIAEVKAGIAAAE